MAVGIFAFCIVSLVYLLGLALDSSRDSQRDTAAAAMIRSLDAELRATPAASLATPSWVTTNTAYFDLTGNRTTNGAKIFYRAKFRSAAADLLGSASNSTNFFLWTVELSYPAPGYAQTNHFILGRGVYASGLANFP